MMATMKDVARLAGVSTATVSATINHSAYVSPELRGRVAEAIKQLGYAPDGVARSLKKGRTHLVGLIVADITNPYFTELVHWVEAAVQEAGYTVLLCDSDEDFDKEMHYLRIMRTYRVDGVIMAPAGQAADYDNPIFKDPGLPLVAVDRADPTLECDAVMTDNHRAAMEATNHLLDLGHRQIGSVTGPEHLFSARERLRGFREALANRQVPVDPAHVRTGNYREADAFEASRDMLLRQPRPTALFVANNHMLVGVMRAIAELGLDCPRDVSVIGIDDFPWADAFRPRMTTVRQPVREIAETAVRLLLARMSGTAPREPVRRILRASLIARDSCAAPAA